MTEVGCHTVFRHPAGTIWLCPVGFIAFGMPCCEATRFARPPIASAIGMMRLYNASSAANSFSIACRVVTQKFYAENAQPSRQDDVDEPLESVVGVNAAVLARWASQSCGGEKSGSRELS